jgi:FG-GAP-like repeat
MSRRGLGGLATVIAITLAGSSLALGFGNFKPATTLPANGDVYQTAVGDVTGDGIPDIVAATDSANPILDGFQVFEGKGHGKFKPGRQTMSGSAPEGIVLGKFNHDKHLDLALADYDADRVIVYLNNGNGSFKAGPILLDTGPGPFTIAAADVNGDGRTDIVSGNYDSTGPDAVSVLLQKAGGGWVAHHDYAAAGGTYGIVAGRVDGNKRADVVTQDADGTVSVLLANANGSLKSPKNRPLPGGDGYDNVALADFNHDGKTDIAAGDYTDDTVHTLLGKGDWAFGKNITTKTGGIGPDGLATGDFNRDGKPDLAIGGYSSPYVLRVVRGRGDGRFHHPLDFTESGSSLGVGAGDLNGDHGADLLVGGNSFVDVFLNKSP